MVRKRVTITLLALVLILAAGCSAAPGGGSGGGRKTIETSEMTEAPGKIVYSGEDAVIDASNASKGYVMVKYNGSADKIQVQVTNPDGSRSPYPFEKGDFHGVPLAGGSGSYTIAVYSHVSGDLYSVSLSKTIQVDLEDQFGPFLYPNQYVEYTNDSECTRYGRKLSDKSGDDIDYITRVFNYVTRTVTYDDKMAENIPVNYLPDPDRTMDKKTGICLDYASLMTAMLRSQGIPTKLEVGYSEDVYHAWISVYLEDKGWVDDVIEFDGHSWTLMDPTLASANDIKSSAKYMKNKDHYKLMYNY